jgi:predicted regulator of Ras-like GTPase activity (Roadblock/LC7/MglB family)
LPIAHRLNRSDDPRIAAVLAASILGAVESVALELRTGDVKDVLTSCNRGKIVALRAGPEAAIIAWCRAETNLGSVLLGLRAAADEIAGVLEGV